MEFRCVNCHNLIARVSGSNFTILGNATIVANFPPSNYHSNWLKCSNCNAWATTGGAGDAARRLEAERRRRQQEQDANRRRLEAERQRREEERRRREEEQRQQAIRSLRQQFDGYKSNLADLERQLSSKQQDMRREEKVQEELTQQRNAERNAIAKFTQERADPNIVRIVLIGETGVGKSTLANRLIGDVSQYCDSAGSVFRVSDSIHSETAAIQKETRNVRMSNGRYKMISVVDTPGLSDSAGRDRHHANMLCDYLRGVERVHRFVIVLSAANPRLDDATMEGLGQLMRMFGRQFWKFVWIVYTNVDTQPVRERLPQNIDDLQARIRGQFGLRVNEGDLNVSWIGFDDYQGGVVKVIETVEVNSFYTCAALQSPLQQLESTLQRQTNKTRSIGADINNLNSRLANVRSNIERTRSSLRGYSVYV